MARQIGLEIKKCLVWKSSVTQTASTIKEQTVEVKTENGEVNHAAESIEEEMKPESSAVVVSPTKPGSSCDN